MKKTLLLTGVALMAVSFSAEAQHFGRNAAHRGITVIDDGAPVAKAPALAAGDEGAELYGAWVMSEVKEGNTLRSCMADTLTAYEPSDSGNVKISLGPDVYVYGQFDGETLTIPVQYANGGAKDLLSGARIRVLAIQSDSVTARGPIVFTTNDDASVLTLDPSLSGWYATFAEGDYRGSRYDMGYGTRFYRANGTFTGVIRTYGEYTDVKLPAYVEEHENQWVVYGGWNPYASVTLTVDPAHGTSTVHVPQNMRDVSSFYRSSFGNYQMLVTKLDEPLEDGFLWDYTEKDVTGTFKDGVADFDGVTFGIFSQRNTDTSSAEYGWIEGMHEISQAKLTFDDYVNTRISALAAEGGNQPADGATYNLAGQRVGKGYKGIVIRGGRKYLQAK